MPPLNPEQLIAVNHVEGPLLVLAGAGSGKTRIVTYRVAHLLELGVPSHEILAVTFTNRAAQEMRERILHLTHQSVLTCTFHSLCARILRESISYLGYPRDFTIYDDEDSDKALRECLVELDIKVEKGEFKQLRSQISQAKNALLEPDYFLKDEALLSKVYAQYQMKLKEYHALDFDDLLFLTVKLFQSSKEVLALYQKRWSFILIDEYQDTNEAQYSITKYLAEKQGNVFAVGDPDQSIYSWRGANIDNILNFSRDFPGAKVIALEQNYRSRSNILEASNALIRHNKNRFEKNLWSDKGEGEKIGLYIAENDHAEADFVIKQLYRLHREKGVSLKDCVIFYRTNFQSRIFEDHLLKERVPYVIVGGLSFYQRKEIKDVLSWLKMLLTGRDFIAFIRTLNLPKRGLGEATLEKLQLAASERGLSVFDFCVQIVSGQVSFKLSQKQLQGLQDYVHSIMALRERLKVKVALHELIAEVLERTRYLDYLREDPESYEERRENVAELVTKAAEWELQTKEPSLPLFLEELTLKGSTEEADVSLDSVKMMTLHNGKGLEFTGVFLVGMEEELFPHINTLENPELLEEERRLCYVGMTRAKEYLFLSASVYRYLWGMPKVMRPSRFLSEIPSDYLHPYHKRVSRELSYVPDGAEDSGYFRVEDTVHHRDFGSGIIQKVYQTSLGVTYDVCFSQTHTTRSLVAKFAKLVKIS